MFLTFDIDSTFYLNTIKKGKTKAKKLSLSVSLNRDHRILGKTFNTLCPPPFMMCLSTKSNFICILQAIQLWHLLANSLLQINKQTQYFVIVIKAPKMGGWGNEKSFSHYRYSSLWFERIVTKLCSPVNLSGLSRWRLMMLATKRRRKKKSKKRPSSKFPKFWLQSPTGNVQSVQRFSRRQKTWNNTKRFTELIEHSDVDSALKGQFNSALAFSVTRLGDFWKTLVTNFLSNIF